MGSHSSVGSLLYVFAFVNIHFVVMETFFFPDWDCRATEELLPVTYDAFDLGRVKGDIHFKWFACFSECFLHVFLCVLFFPPHVIAWDGNLALEKKAAPLWNTKKKKKGGKKSDLPLKKHHLISETLEAACQASDVLYSGVISGFRWTEEPRCIWPLSVQDSIKAKSDLFCFSFSFAPLLFLLISLQFTVLYWHEW